MKRKEFLETGIMGAVLPLVLNGLPLKAFAESPLTELLKKGNKDRVLVLIQLNGGNDGLNTVIPLDQYTALMNARANIAIPENKALALTGSLTTGLHPALAEIRNLYNNGYISIVQNVGYPNPDYSHFRSTDIWLTGSDSNQYLSTGWMGRYLDTKFPGFPTGYPSTAQPDPPAIQIGPMVSPALQGANMSLGMSITDPTNFYNFLNGTVDPAPNTPMGHELSFVRLVAQQTQQYAGSVKGAADKATNKSSLYPTAGTNSLADQLKIVARLVAGGLQTQVYMVSLGGFDTHATQVDATAGTDKGAHATLLSKISVAVNAFQDDLKLLGVEDKVLGMTFSEFGRRIKSNSSLGTDHGAAAPLFVFGKNVVGGIYGKNPLLPANAGVNDNLVMEFDFRSVYASLLKDWFGLSDTELNSTLLKSYPIIPFVNPAVSSVSETKFTQKFNLQIYPNPARTYTQLSFSSTGAHTQITITDIQGKENRILAQEYYSPGQQEIWLDLSGFKEGIYLIRVEQDNNVATSRLLIN